MSKIKIFQASAFYQSFINDFYTKHKNIKDKSYDIQINIIQNEGTGWYDTWSYYFNKNDLFELKAYITNAEFAQKKWAQENGVKINSQKWREEVLIAQLVAYKPNILFAHDHWVLHSILPQIKDKVPSIKIVFGWDGVLYHSLDLFKNCDIILSPVRETVKFYSDNNKHAFEFNFGFHQEVLNQIQSKEPKYDCTFIGQFDTKGQHSERYKILSNLSKAVKIDLWTPSLGFLDWKRYYYYQLKRLLHLKFSEIIQVHKFKKLNHGDIYGLEMYQVIASSRIVINSHIDQVGNYAANMRLFEVTGAGSCLVTDYKDNISDYFDDNTEIITYKNTEELVSKVKYLLSNEHIRKEIADRGQKRTLICHNYQLRFEKFANYLFEIYNKS